MGLGRWGGKLRQGLTSMPKYTVHTLLSARTRCPIGKAGRYRKRPPNGNGRQRALKQILQ